MAKCYDFKCYSEDDGYRHPTGYMIVEKMIDADMEVERANFLTSYYNIDSIDQQGELQHWSNESRESSLARLRKSIDKLYPAI